MKFFVPVYAVALTLAVTSDMFEQASATACTADDPCPTGAVCATVADGVTAQTAFAKPPALDCGAKQAFISTLKIAPTTAGLAATKYGLAYKVGSSGTAVTTLATGTAATAVTGACDNYYTDVAKDATGAVTAVVGCAADAGTCALKYTATWACQVASCATSCTDAKCKSETVEVGAPLELSRPAVADLAACETGKYAYLSSFEVGGVDGTTTYDQFTVAFTSGTGASLTKLSATKDYSVCDARWTDVGKTTTADMKATITCVTAPCSIKYKAVWACQAPATTPAPTPKSGAAGVCPVAAWGTALVAAVAGANFAAPL